MKKTSVAILITSLCLAQATLWAEDDALLTANQNFGPRKDTAVTEEPAKPAPAAQPVVAKPAPVVQAVVAKPAAPADPTVQEEVIRRQEAQLRAKAMIDDGQKLYHDGKYEEAIAKLEEALKILPRAKATEIEASRAKHGLADSYYKLAEIAYQAKDYEKAKTLANKSLEHDRSNLLAENVLVKIKGIEREAQRAKVEGTPAPGTPALDATPEFIAKKNQIKKLFREAKVLLNSGQYDDAEKRFKQILLLDRYNSDAYRLLTEVNDARMNTTDWALDATRARRLWEVADAWVPPLGQEVRLPLPSETKPISTSIEAAKITERLNKIIFPSVDFREAAISDVVKFLGDESRRLDPDKVGVNFVLGAGVPTSAPAPAAEGAPPPPAAPSSIRPVTLSLKNIPMIEALKYITQMANLKYRVDANAVLILPFDAPDTAMITRSYPITAGALKTVTVTPTGGGGAGGGIGGIGGGTTTTMGGGSDPISAGPDVKLLFQESGVPFPPGSSITYSERTSKILIRNTPENLEIFERVLADLNVIPSQVEIETKFVDISSGTLDELGFDWWIGNQNPIVVSPADKLNQILWGGGTGGVFSNPSVVGWLTGGIRDSSLLPGSAVESLLANSMSGGSATRAVANQLLTFQSIMSQPDFQVIVNALAQRKGTDVLSAPKITTISGAQAQVRVVQEFIYPTEFSTPSTGAGGVTTSIPSGFRTREVGVILNVTPTVGPDGYTINLTLVPEVSEFRGFIDYSPPTSSTASTTGGPSSTVSYKILQPLFETRNLQTSIVVWDGQTVVLGGLMREDVAKLDDKVPFLGDIPIIGRLFRSKVTNRSKRNLLIFVTANLIDPAGNRIHRQDATALH